MRPQLGQGGALLASAARTATTVSDYVTNVVNGQQLAVVIDVTDVGEDSPSITATIQGFDPTTGKTWTILASAAISTVSTTVLRVSPHLTASANAIAKDIIPGMFRVSVAHDDADEITYAIGYSLT